MIFSYDDPEIWTLVNESLEGYAAPYIGNGIRGTRLGIFVLGTDPEAPEWHGCTNLPQRKVLPPHDPAQPLPSFSSFVYDRRQFALTAWTMLDLTVDGVRYTPHSGTHHFRQTLDLRCGLAELHDEWEYATGRIADISISLLHPRTIPNGGAWELAVEAPHASISASFGLEAHHLAPDLTMSYRIEGTELHGDGNTSPKGRPIREVMRWHCEEAIVTTDISGQTARVSAKAVSTLRISVRHVLGGGLDDNAIELYLRRDLDEFNAITFNELVRRELKAWRPLWAQALNPGGMPTADAKLLLAGQYYLLASMSDKIHPLGALGLSNNTWGGCQLWDADLWIFRAVLPLWPEFAARIVRFNHALLPMARAFAVSQGRTGAWFPWLHDENGVSLTPHAYLTEIHNNCWIALAAWELSNEGHNQVLLRELAWPLLQGAAEFFADWAECDEDGIWHLRGVIGPDEAVAEELHTTVDDNVLTNAAVKRVLETAVCAAAILGNPVPTNWHEVAAGLLLLPPRADGVIPQHTGYHDGPCKQADTILAFFYDLLIVPSAVQYATIDWYHARLQAGGPLMTTQIEAGILLRLGGGDVALQRLFDTYREFVRGPFLVPFETRLNDTAVMLTGIGGLLQALMVGRFGWSPGNDAAVPRLGTDWPAL